MTAFPKDPEAFRVLLGTSPPVGSPYSVPLPGSEKEGRSAVYRHWRFRDQPLLKSLDASVTTAHEAFESTVKRQPKSKCLGTRSWDPVTRTYGNYEWITYAETAERRRNFGAGLVELHKSVGVSEDKYGVGLWCQNRPEWQITGVFSTLLKYYSC